jgi:hypothetical protein
MTAHSVGWDDLTCLVVDGGGWDSRAVDLPDELKLRNEQALAVFIAVQNELQEYWRAAAPEQAE